MDSPAAAAAATVAAAVPPAPFDLLPEELLRSILSCTDPITAAHVMQPLSRRFRELVSSARFWRGACWRQFGLSGVRLQSHCPLTAWKQVYAHCHLALRRSRHIDETWEPAAMHAAILTYRGARAIRVGDRLPRSLRLPLCAMKCSDTEMEFADSYPPQNAFSGYIDECWATSRFHHRNVSVAAKVCREHEQRRVLEPNSETGCFALVLGFGAVGAPDGFFTNPAHEILCFGSCRRPRGEASDPFLGDERYHRLDEGGGGRRGNGGRRNESLLRSVLADLGPESAARRARSGRAALPGEPLCAIVFPTPPEHNQLEIMQPVQPVLCRYARFLILSAYNFQAQDDANVDVGGLEVFGVHVPELNGMLEEDEEDEEDEEWEIVARQSD